MAPRSARAESRGRPRRREDRPRRRIVRRGSRWMSVDLPEPVAPTSATRLPGIDAERHVVEHAPIGSW